MKTASMLVDPVKYSNAYKKGKEDAESNKPHNNIFSNTEEKNGYDDGFMETVKKLLGNGNWKK